VAELSAEEETAGTLFCFDGNTSTAV